jgi:hypothetical protein
MRFSAVNSLREKVADPFLWGLASSPKLRCRLMSELYSSHPRWQAVMLQLKIRPRCQARKQLETRPGGQAVTSEPFVPRG